MLLPFDELDNLIEGWRMPFRAELDREQVIDEIYEMLVLAYVYGWTNVGENLDIDLPIDVEHAERTIYKPIEGKTWVNRVDDAFDDAVVTDDGEMLAPNGLGLEPLIEVIIRIVETETTRVFGEGEEEAADRAAKEHKRPVVKTWVTMGDERVRDTHAFLNGTTINAGELFWTIDGDSAKNPGGFSKAQNNVNCRCWLNIAWEKATE